MTIKEIQDEIIKEFSTFENWTDCYMYLIKLGKRMPVIDNTDKTDINLIRGCQSKVWLKGETINDKIIFSADSDTLLTKGIISILIRVFSNQTAEDILTCDMDFINQIGLKEHLYTSRVNGLVSMLNKIKTYAENK